MGRGGLEMPGPRGCVMDLPRCGQWGRREAKIWPGSWYLQGRRRGRSGYRDYVWVSFVLKPLELATE